MSLVFVDRYGAPDYGTRKGTKGIILHTTEGSGRTKAAALATAVWQAGTGNTSGGSYNYILGIDGDVVTAVRSVHPDHAAGGISTRRDSVWQPWQELYDFMGATAVADPNAWVCQIAIQGQVAWYEANGWPQAMVDAIAMLIKQLENRYSIPDIYVGAHYMFQTNRTDPGLKLIPLVIDSYIRQFRSAPVPAPAPAPVNTLTTVRTFPAPGASFALGPSVPPINLFQITGWTPEGQPQLKRIPENNAGIQWSGSTSGLATERRTWKGADAEGWLYCPQMWVPGYGTLKDVYISKAPLPEPKIIIPDSIEALKAENTALRDQLSVATAELKEQVSLNASLTSQLKAARDRIIAAKNALG